MVSRPRSVCRTAISPTGSFPAPLPVGSKVRLRARVVAARPVAGEGAELTVAMTVERDGGDKPVAAAEAVYRYYPALTSS